MSPIWNSTIGYYPLPSHIVVSALWSTRAHALQFSLFSYFVSSSLTYFETQPRIFWVQKFQRLAIGRDLFGHGLPYVMELHREHCHDLCINTPHWTFRDGSTTPSMCLSCRRFFFPSSVVKGYLKQAADAMQEFQIYRDGQHLRAAIQYYEEAYSLSNQKHSYFPGILINYAAALNLRDQGSSSGQSRFQIIGLLEEARLVIERRNSRPTTTYCTVLVNLGRCYLDRYRETKTEKDRNAAMDTFRLALTPQVLGGDAGSYLLASIGLATALLTSCEFRRSSNDVADLEEAIRLLNEALGRSDGDSDTQADCFKNLGLAYNLLFQRTENPSNLDRAIEYNEEAVRLLRQYDPSLTATTFNLAQQYCARYARNRRSSDLEMAFEGNRRARDLVQNGLGNPELLKDINDFEAHLSMWQARDASDQPRQTQEGEPSRSRGGQKPSSKRFRNLAASASKVNKHD